MGLFHIHLCGGGVGGQGWSNQHEFLILRTPAWSQPSITLAVSCCAWHKNSLNWKTSPKKIMSMLFKPLILLHRVVCLFFFFFNIYAKYFRKLLIYACEQLLMDVLFWFALAFSLSVAPLSFLTQILLIKLAGFLPPPVSCFISTTFSQAAQTERRSRAEQRPDSWHRLCCCLLSGRQRCERRFLEEPFDTQYQSKAICESTLMPTNGDAHIEKGHSCLIPRYLDPNTDLWESETLQSVLPAASLSLNPNFHLQQ